MVFANGYKLVYVKDGKIYASKDVIPTEADKELCKVADLKGRDFRNYKGEIYELTEDGLSKVDVSEILHAHRDANDDGFCDEDHTKFDDGKEPAESEGGEDEELAEEEEEETKPALDHEPKDENQNGECDICEEDKKVADEDDEDEEEKPAAEDDVE